MSIEDLYPRVTEAIVRAERLARAGDSSAARSAFLGVSMLEEEIADELPATDPEGALARTGAVVAAMWAEVFVRARELASRYRREEGSSVAGSMLIAERIAASLIDDSPVVVDPSATFEVEP